MDCGLPECTGVHDNNRYRELCPWALMRKRDRDWRWHYLTLKGALKRTRGGMATRQARLAELEALVNSLVGGNRTGS